MDIYKKSNIRDMKYSEYHQFRQLFERDEVSSRGYDLNEWNNLPVDKKTQELGEILEIAAMNEAIGLALGGGLLAGGAGLLKLGSMFRKNLVSLGFKKGYIKSLSKIAAKFKEEATSALKDAYSKFFAAKKAIYQAENVESFEDLSDPKKEEVKDVEKSIIKVFNETIDNLAALKKKEVYSKIEKQGNLTDGDKLALKGIWESLSVEAKVTLLGDLMKTKVIESDEYGGLLNKAMEKKKGALAKTLEKVQTGYKKEKKGEEGAKKDLDYFKKALATLSDESLSDEQKNEKLTPLYKELELALADGTIKDEEKKAIWDKLESEKIPHANGSVAGSDTAETEVSDKIKTDGTFQDLKVKFGNIATEEGLNKETRKKKLEDLYNLEIKPSKNMSTKEKKTLQKLTQEAIRKL